MSPDMAYNPGQILAAQLAPWIGCGMKVTVYARKPKECPICGSAFDMRSFSCPNHPEVIAKYLKVRVSGISDRAFAAEGRRWFYSDLSGNILTFANTPGFVQELHRRIAVGSFDVRDFIRTESDRLLVKNYAKMFVDEQKGRTEKKAGSAKWLSLSAYNEIERYVRLYIVPTLGHVSIKGITKTSQVESWMDSLVDSTGDDAGDTVRQKAMNVLRTMLHWAAKKGDIVPVSFTFPATKKGKRDLVTVTSGQQAEIVAKAQPADVAILRWTAKKPHRTNENRAFRVRDFDFSRRVYRLVGAFDEEVYKPFPKVAGKGGSEFELDDEDIEIIRLALTGRDVQPDDYVFVNKSESGSAKGLGDRPYTHRALDNKFRRARIAAGYPEVTLEQFGRHSWVKQRLDEGWSFTQISHYTLNDERTLQRFYANVTVANRRAIIRLKRATG